MSAEILRKAASLMRQRANVATEGPWIVDGIDVRGPGNWMDADFILGFDASPLLDDAEHIASWHPAVALAVADWLDSVAAEWERWPGPALTRDEPALAIARAYLGEGGDQ